MDPVYNRVMPHRAARRPRPDKRVKRKHPALIGIGIVCLAGGLRFAGLGQEELWYDEAFSYHMASLPHPLVYILHDYNPPLYYLLLRAWAAVAGFGEFALRSLSALFGTAFVAVVLWAGARLCNRRVAVWAGLFAAVAPLHVYYSQEMRGYALLTVELLVCLTASFLALEERHWKWWALASASALAALYTHYFSLFALAVLPVIFLVSGDSRRDRGQWLRFGTSLSAVGVLYLPWLYLRFVVEGPGAGRTADIGWRSQMWDATHPLLAIPRTVEAFLLAGDSNVRMIFLKQFSRVTCPAGLRYLGMAALAAVAAVVISRHGDTLLGRADITRTKARLAALFLVPLLAMWGISFFVPIYLSGRYDLVAFPGFVLLVGIGLAKLHAGGSVSRAGLALIVVALGTAIAVKLTLYYGAAPSPLQSVTAERLRDAVGQDDTVVFTRVRGVTVLYYLNRLGFDWDRGICRDRSSGKSFTCRILPTSTENTLVFDEDSSRESMRSECRTLLAGVTPGKSMWVVFGGGSVKQGRFLADGVDQTLVDEVLTAGFVPAQVDGVPAVFRFSRP
jgi:4-amino-4-deoxy-L-arabinose transferase-like glycosyltransferase